MSNNIFLRDPDFYQRCISPIEQYIEQNSFYLYKMTGKPIEECKQYIVDRIKSPNSKAIDPIVNYFERMDNGDSEKTQLKLSQYINEVNKNEEILAPTFTTYLNPKIKQSILVEFIDNNVKRRSSAKKEAFKAEADGNIDLFIIKNNEQTNMKLYNNSMSGAFATKGSVLHNPSAHSTLTSTTRSISSLGNASNEKIIAGNRHYFSPDITLYNLISIVSSIDKEQLNNIIVKYNLVYPTKQDVIDCIKYSSDLYWRDEKAFKKIYDFIDTLDDIERAGFVYIGDLYHIRKHNELFVRTLLKTLSSKITNITYDNPIQVIHSSDEQVVNLAHLICMHEVRGKGKDYDKMPISDVNTLAATCNHISETIISYKDFIEAIYLTNNVPCSTAHLPHLIRRTVVLSDTDSTIFSIDEFVQWYFGELVFTDEAYAIASSVMFIATQCIAHNLAILSANINVERGKLFKAQMKPEFLFDSIAVTPVAKHYFASIMVKEGNVYEKNKMEIKGVHLKNSATPKTIIKAAEAKMTNILRTVTSGNKISILQELKDVADIERSIKESLLKGETTYYKFSKIKNPEAYSNGAELSPYQHHMLWTEVFHQKYGTVDLPPYTVIKIPTIVENTTALKKWIDSIEDKDLATRLMTWLTKFNKTSLPTMYISEMFVKSFGIPEEIKCIINTKKVILDLTITNRLILQTLGYFPKVDSLISELGY